MKIHQLFEELKVITQDKEQVFTDSGMENCYDKMQYGFFPLGLGILDENNKEGGLAPTEEIEEGGVMILGNDFGTVSYVEKVKKDNGGIGETKSQTISNIVKRGVDIDLKNTFFTNFHLGVRLDSGLYCGTTMTKRMYNGEINRIKREYWELCHKFFVKQLEFLKPRIVICLGHEVKNALIDTEGYFNNWEHKSLSIEKLYKADDYIMTKELDKPIFVIVSHPCYLVNFKTEYVKKLNIALKNSFTS